MVRDDTNRKLKVVNGLLQQILRTKTTNNTRRKRYISEIQNSLKVLCSESTDLVETKKKLEETRASSERHSRKRTVLCDRVIELERLNIELSVLPARLEAERDSKHHMEESYGRLLAKNTKLEEKVRILTEKLKNKEND